MSRFVILALVLTASVTAQVEHAPTVAQCQADQRLWLAEIGKGDSPNLPSNDVLFEWGNEMQKCSAVDPEASLHYCHAYAEMNTMRLGRLLHFIERHDLVRQFVEEDAAGKR